MRVRSLPNFAQLKYLPAFLNAREKRLVLGALGVVMLSTLAWIGLFISHHVVSGAGPGGTYSEALVGQPKYINPIFASTSDIDSDITSLTYSGLLGYDSNQKLIPILAAHYTISADGRLYDITLRNDMRWADGEPVTPDDILFTFESIQNPEVGSPLISSFEGIKIDKIDDATIRFTLKEPFAPFLHSLTVGILPEHRWGDLAPGSLRLAKNNLEPIGAGPWMFDKLTKDNGGTITTLTLKHNPYFPAIKPHLELVTFKFFVDFASALEALRSQTALGLSFVPSEESAKLPQKNFTFSTIHLPEYVALFFNQTKNAFLKTDDVRAALERALNKPEMIESALKGEGEWAVGPFVSGMAAPDAAASSSAFDVSAANALLDKYFTRVPPEEYFSLRQSELKKNLGAAQASSTAASSTIMEPAADTSGLAETVRKEMPSDQTFFRKNKDGIILKLTLTTGDTSDYQTVAEAIARYWHAIGVATQIQLISPRQIGREIIKTRDYEVLLYAEIIGADPDPFAFWHSSQVMFPGLNLSLYANRSVDKLLEDARSTTDEAKRIKLYNQFAQILAADRPAIFLYSPQANFITNTTIKGIRLPKVIFSPAGRLAALSEWYINTAKRWRP